MILSTLKASSIVLTVYGIVVFYVLNNLSNSYGEFFVPKELYTSWMSLTSLMCLVVGLTSILGLCLIH